MSGELQRYRRELGDFTEELEGHYMGHDSTWRSDFEEVRNTFNADLSRLDSVDDVRALFTNANHVIEESLKGLLRKVREECETELDEMGGAFTAATEHKPPQLDFASLERAAQEKAKVEQPIYEKYEGFSFAFWNWVRPWSFKVKKKRQVGTKTVVDEGRKLMELQGTLLTSFNRDLDEITSEGGTVESAVKSYLRSVDDEGKRLVEQRQGDLDAIKKRKESNDKLSGQIEQLAGQLVHLNALLDRLRTATANL